LNKFLSLHILTINRVINLPTVSSGYSEVYCRSVARSGASRKLGVVVTGRCSKRWSGSEARSGNGAGSGGYRKRLERGAAFTPLTLRLHALLESQAMLDCWL